MGYYGVKVPRESINVTSATVAGISITVGDYIVNTHGTQFRVDGIDYDNVEVFCIDGEESYTFPFASFEDGYYKVVR